jgi:hypothetical protein
MSNPTDALYSLDPNCGRDDWVKILMSFKSAGGDMDAAENWSAQGDTFDAHAFRATWRSIKEGGYTEKTLYFLAREAGWQPSHMDSPKPAPKVKHPLRKGPSPSYKRAKEFWRLGRSEGAELHPYAVAKKITHPFGAKRATLKLGDRGGAQDCLLIPNKDWQERLVGVEVILPKGKKYTFGSKGHLILGYPEAAPYVHIAEGWGTMFALSQMFPKQFAGIVVFGKHALEKVAEEAAMRYPGRVIIHGEAGKFDVWDMWNAGRGDEYKEGILEVGHG